VRYAGYYYCCANGNVAYNLDYSSASIYTKASGLSISNSTIRDGGGTGLYVVSASPAIESSVIERHGSGVYLTSSSATITGSTISNNAGYGLRAESSSAALVTSNAFSENGTAISVDTASSSSVISGNAISGPGGIQIEGGTLSTSATWSVDAPYVLRGVVMVAPGVILTIEAGAVVKSFGPGSLAVYGTLIAAGTPTAPIAFTSYVDDTVGGDTNGDGNATTPQTGTYGAGWVGIGFAASSTANVLDHVEVRYAGSGSSCGGNCCSPPANFSVLASVFTATASLAVTNSAIVDGYRGCTNAAFHVSGASPLIAGTRLLGHHNGIYVTNGSPQITGNSISAGWGGCGVCNSNSDVVVSALGNYWGSPSGPNDQSDDRATGGWYNLNPGGTRVSDYVNYGSWLAGDPNLQATYALAGTVFSGQSFAPLAGAAVFLGPYSATTNAQGVFSFAAVPGSAFLLRAIKAGFSTYQAMVDLAATSSRVVYLTPQSGACAPGSLAGQVIDKTTGAATPGVTVKLSNGQTAQSAAGTGGFSFTGLAPTSYTLSASPTGFAPFSTAVAICGDKRRDVQLTRASTTYGMKTPAPIAGDPVNLATGSFVYGHVDLQLPGKGMPFVFERTYNSHAAATDSPLGFGWAHSYDTRRSVDGDGNVTIRWGDGRTVTFAPDGQGGFTGQYGVFDRVAALAGGGHELETKGLLRYRFAATGELLEVRDRNENVMTLSYAAGRLAQVTDTSGRAIKFSYGANGRLASVADPLPRTIRFGYDGVGNLTSVIDARGHVMQLTYDNDHQLLTVGDRRGNPVVSNTYDAARRVVVHQSDALGSTSSYAYDEVNRRTVLVRDAAAGGLAIREVYFYDDLLRLVREEDGLGHAMAYVYDAAGNRTEAKNKRGFTTLFAYDARGNVTRKTDALGNVTQITYDGDDNPLTRTDARGKTTAFTYDTRGNLIRTRDALGYEAAIVYDSAGLPKILVDARGKITLQDYDAEGNLTQVRDARNFDTFYQYDSVGRRIVRTDANNHVTRWQYDANDNVTSTTAPDGGVTSAVFDENDNQTSVTDPLLRVAGFIYDEKDRLVEAIDPLGKRSRYEYDALDRRIAEVDRTGRRTEFTYDTASRLVGTRDARGDEWVYRYDEAGNRIAAEDPLGHVTEMGYDGLDRLVSVKDALQHETKTVYDELGRVIETEDARQKKTHFGYDDIGRLTQVTDARGGVIGYAYDGNGNRTRQTEPEGDVTVFAYDELNRLIRKDEPLGGFWLYDYDPVGNRTSMRDANGAVTTYGYDENDRLETALYPGGPAVTYVYDLAGRTMFMTDGLGTASYAYDEADRLLSVTDAFGKTVGHRYDDEGRRERLIYPSGQEVVYGYDAAGRLERVTDWLGGVTEYLYDDAGRLLETQLPNGTRTLPGFDDANRLTSLAHWGPGQAEIASWAYVLDPVGNPTQETRSQPVEASPPAATELYEYEGENRILSRETALAGLDAYAHDGNGNRIQSEGPTGIRTQIFDARNLMVTRAGPAGITQHGYDGDGRRLRRIENGAETRFVLDTLPSLFRVLQQTDANGVVQASYVYGLGLLSRIDAAGQRSVYHYDRQGSTVALTDGTGVVVDANSYDPYGQMLASAASTPNPFLFSGSEGVSAEGDGLLFARARFLEPDTGQFIARDPLLPGGSDTQAANRYAYAMNRPLVMSDASGMRPVFQSQGSSDALHGFVLDLRVAGTTAATSSPGLLPRHGNWCGDNHPGDGKNPPQSEYWDSDCAPHDLGLGEVVRLAREGRYSEANSLLTVINFNLAVNFAEKWEGAPTLYGKAYGYGGTFGFGAAAGLGAAAQFAVDAGAVMESGAAAIGRPVGQGVAYSIERTVGVLNATGNTVVSGATYAGEKAVDGFNAVTNWLGGRLYDLGLY
jgi:RHS repeat-associated protein